jgi:hypothetical protein
MATRNVSGGSRRRKGGQSARSTRKGRRGGDEGLPRAVEKEVAAGRKRVDRLVAELRPDFERAAARITRPVKGLGGALAPGARPKARKGAGRKARAPARGQRARRGR